MYIKHGKLQSFTGDEKAYVITFIINWKSVMSVMSTTIVKRVSVFC